MCISRSHKFLKTKIIKNYNIKIVYCCLQAKKNKKRKKEKTYMKLKKGEMRYIDSIFQIYHYYYINIVIALEKKINQLSHNSNEYKIVLEQVQ